MAEHLSIAEQLAQMQENEDRLARLAGSKSKAIEDAENAALASITASSSEQAEPDSAAAQRPQRQKKAAKPKAEPKPARKGKGGRPTSANTAELISQTVKITRSQKRMLQDLVMDGKFLDMSDAIRSAIDKAYK